MNEAIVKGGGWRQQGEEGRLGWPVYWLYHMFSWPAYYSDLSSPHPLSEELEPGPLSTISTNGNRAFADNSICLSLLQQLYTRGHRCATFSLTELLGWVITTWSGLGPKTFCFHYLCNSHQSLRLKHSFWQVGLDWEPSPSALTSISASQQQLCCTRGIFPLFTLHEALLASVGNQPVKEWVRAVGGHGPGILSHRRGHRVCAAILFHTGGQLISQSKLLQTIEQEIHEQHNQPHP